MLLYEHPLSSYAQKVKIALREKGLPFRTELPADSAPDKRTVRWRMPIHAPKCRS